MTPWRKKVLGSQSLDQTYVLPTFSMDVVDLPISHAQRRQRHSFLSRGMQVAEVQAHIVFHPRAAQERLCLSELIRGLASRLAHPQ